MDSSLNVGSLTLTRDIYQGFIRPQAPDRELIWVSRITTLLMVIPAMALALYFQNLIHILWISADIYASGMFFPVVGMLYLKNPSRWSGILAMSFGITAVTVGALIQNGILPNVIGWPIWPYSTLISLGLSGFGFVLGHFLPRQQSKTPQEMEPQAGLTSLPEVG
jgi:SSS family solute:Na+ symporter